MHANVGYVYQRHELGLLVAFEHVESSHRWVRLPLPPPPPTRLSITTYDEERRHSAAAFDAAYEELRQLMGPLQPADEADDPPTKLRRRAEFAAARTPQGDWTERVYESVTGPRWRCCQNDFLDGHTPWCPA